jgi:hypothetical protein
MNHKPLRILSMLTLYSCTLQGQSTTKDTVYAMVAIKHINLEESGQYLVSADSFQFTPETFSCKKVNLGTVRFRIYQYTPGPIPIAYAPALPIVAVQIKEPTLKVNGDLAYNHSFSRSDANDLVFANTQLDQVALRLKVVYKGKPYSVNARYSHSTPFQIDDNFEIDLKFDKNLFERTLRDKLFKKIEASAKQYEEALTKKLDSLRNIYWAKKDSLNKLPSYDQRIRDFARYGNLYEEKPDSSVRFAGLNPSISIPQTGTNLDSLAPKMSLDNLDSAFVKSKKGLVDSLKHQYDSLTRLLTTVNGLRNDIQAKKYESGINSKTILEKYTQLAKYTKLKDSVADELSSIKMPSLPDVRLGKFIFNNSELTVYNVFLKGLSVSTVGDKSITVAGGFLDYGFSRFVIQPNGNSGNSNQFIALVRYADKSKKDKETAYNAYYGIKNTTGTSSSYPLYGYSMEQNYKLNTQFTFKYEVARSVGFNTITNSKDKAIGLVDIDRIDNFGLYGLLEYANQQTKTTVTSTVRYLGDRFESYNASQLFNPGNSYILKAKQTLWHDRLTFDGQINHSDFSRTILSNNINSKLTFYSIAATVNIRKLPVIQVGYYPGVQTFISNNNKLYQFHYYLLNGNISHQIRIKDNVLSLFGSMNLNQNSFSDSATVISNHIYTGRAIFTMHNLSFSGGFSQQHWQDGDLNIYEGGLQYGYKNFNIGCNGRTGIKNGINYYGYNLSAGILIKNIGSLNIHFDKGFFPDRIGQFQTVYAGQVQFIKTINFSL